MNDTAATTAARDADFAPAAMPEAPHRPYRGRLFRKYLALILTLVTIALLASGGLSLYFTYQETKSALAGLQHEKALAAAARIEQYIRQIEQQIRYAALPQLDASDVDARRIEFLKVLRQAPEITDIAEVDGAGREQIAVSRLGMDSLRSNKDRSQEPAFRDAKRGQPYFSPVYFRKETEPYMTIAVRSGGDKGPVTIADVNLKFVWDVVSRIKIGESGKAYVVDSNGFLVADPDIGLVLRKTNMSDLSHVKAARDAHGDAELAMVSRDLAGTEVLTSFAPIESLNWNVFAEQPVAEVNKKRDASILRTALLLVAGLALSAVGAWALARGMVRPIRILEDGAQRIGAGDLDQKIDIRTHDELESLAGGFNRMSAQLKDSYAGLERKVEERTQALQSALEQQTAISEILRVISSSPTDVQPVADAVVERAARLCDAPFARLILADQEMLKSAAEYAVNRVSVPPMVPVPLRRTTFTGRAILERQTIHIADAAEVLEREFPDARANVVGSDIRTVLAVPLIHEGGAYGSILMFRQEVRPFSADQVALVETFARQAAIAINNVRLFNETKEALEQQTAISEILRVISSSPTDVRPMLNAVAERALKLCDAAQATIVLAEGDNLRCVAAHGSTRTLDQGELMPLTRGSVAGRAVFDGVPFQVEDLAAASEDDLPVGRELQRRIGHHTALAVPLMREGHAIGAIQLWRMEKRLFSERQVALVNTFADQAAIAINNVRLFNETKEALEQQTAISEILRVISSSPGDVRPMLSAVAERALKLCDAAEAGIFLIDGKLLRFATGVGTMSIPDEHAAFPLNRELVIGRAAIDGTTLHYADIVPLLDTEYPDARANQQKYGFRALLAVPLMREQRAIGAIALWRTEPRAFTDKQIALINTFANQAAIAIENVRLFNETKEALEQQTAISEILRVISSSPTDVQPVFDIIGERAEKLCDAELSFVSRVDGDAIRLASIHGIRTEAIELARGAFPMPLDAETVTARTIRSRSVQNVADVLSDAEYETKEVAKAAGYRAALGVPMLRDDAVIGAIFVARRDPGLFSDSQIALLKTFADQAAIAIQNVRLFNETKEGLEQQTAVAEILRVISSSPTDVIPVLDAIAERAARLSDASSSSMYLVDGENLRHLASRGPAAEPVTHLESFPITRGSIAGRALLDRTTMHIADMLAVADEYPLSAEFARRYGHRTLVVVPLFREGNPFGAIALRRLDVRPFSDREIALLRTFGDQAAIALENVRLFNETKEALEQQRAAGEVLTAISSSIADTKPVFETILSSCERLFAGKVIAINLLGDDGHVRRAAYRGPDEDKLTAIVSGLEERETGTWLAIERRAVLHYPDIASDLDVPPGIRLGSAAVGVGAGMIAPMIWESKGIGAIMVGRDHVGPFSDKEIALLKTFADQAVIAIQNARLFNETKEALEQQRASAEVLTAISSSIADTKPVFDVILHSCERLFAGDIVGVMFVRDNMLDLGAYTGRGSEELRKRFPIPLTRDTVTGTAVLEQRIVAYADVDAPDLPPRTRELAAIVGYRSIASAPMIFEGRSIGGLWVARSFRAPFNDKQLSLLKTFADQAVIAIQNARLFHEIQDKSRQLEIANKHKSDFLANMSHELRTPLNAIIGFSEVLLERFFGDVNEKQDDYLRDIHSSGKHLLSLINDILDLSKVEAGRMELEPSSFDVASALSNALTLIRERAQRHGIALGQDVDPALGPIFADERKFKQILLNLLSNAVKFTPDGGQINVSARREDSHAVIAVRDTGVGIAPEDQAAVFEEFRQVGHDYTRKQEGTGLGLALTRKFVELHGGRIWVDSAPGKGSTFTFTIPLHPDKVALH